MDILKHRQKYFFVSGLIILIGIIFIFINGINFDIEFKGGTAITVDLKQEFDNNNIENIVKDVTGETPLVQKTGNENTTVKISTEELSEEQQNQITEKLKENNQDIGEFEIRNIGASYGDELRKNIIITSLVLIILVIIYIVFRFKTMDGLKSSLSAVVGLIHNILVVCSVYIIFKIPVNSAFIAVILTVIGYSINDVVVFYDRIKENQNASKKETLDNLVNNSVSQVFKRTMNTTLTTVGIILILLVFAVIYKQQSLIYFTLPLSIGIITAAYSSICISVPLWYIWQKGKMK